MRPWSAIATLLVPVVGCSATVVDDDEDVASAREAATQGNVTVERTVILSGAADGTEVVAQASARFVAVSGGMDHDLADRVVGSPRELPATESCVWHEAGNREPLPPTAADGSIELLDVGEVLLHAGLSVMPLAARAFPDVGDLVSGVVYTSRSASTELPPGVPYVIETTGSSFADDFRVSVDAPRAPEELLIGAQLVHSDELTMVIGEPLNLQWTASDHGSDRIYVDLAAGLDGAGDRPLPTVRCVFEDDGEAQLPSQFTSFAEDPAEVELAVHRLRRSVVQVPEIDEAFVEFDFAILVRLVVAEAP